jgi:MFS family permease
MMWGRPFQGRQRGAESPALQSLPLPRFTRALRHRNYRLFFSGQLVSLVGTWMQGIAESWLVYRLTGSAALLGVAGFASQIPVLFLATIGGSVADRYNRHRILIVTQTASMVLPLTLAALVFSGRVQVWHVFALAASLGVVNAFDVPARQSFVVEMVGKEDLVNAIALNSSIVNAARAIGPAVAGVLIAAVGEGWCFLINGISYVAVIAGLLMMRLPPRLQTGRPPAALAHATHGFRYVRKTMPVRDLLLMVAVISFAGMPYSTLMPIFAEEILRGGARGLGLLMASAGVGSLCGALTLASRSTIRGLGRVVGASALVFGLALTMFALSRVYWLSAVLLFVVGMSMITQAASTNTLVQSMVPDSVRGRVMAIYAMSFMGMAPIGALVEGWIAERIGAPYTVMIGGFVCVAGAIVFNVRLPRLRAMARQLIDAQRVEATGAGE